MRKCDILFKYIDTEQRKSVVLLRRAVHVRWVRDAIKSNFRSAWVEMTAKLCELVGKRE